MRHTSAGAISSLIATFDIRTTNNDGIRAFPFLHYRKNVKLE